MNNIFNRVRQEAPDHHSSSPLTLNIQRPGIFFNQCSELWTYHKCLGRIFVSFCLPLLLCIAFTVWAKLPRSMAWDPPERIRRKCPLWFHRRLRRRRGKTTIFRLWHKGFSRNLEFGTFVEGARRERTRCVVLIRSYHTEFSLNYRNMTIYFLSIITLIYTYIYFYQIQFAFLGDCIICTSRCIWGKY